MPTACPKRHVVPPMPRSRDGTRNAAPSDDRLRGGNGGLHGLTIIETSSQSQGHICLRLGREFDALATRSSDRRRTTSRGAIRSTRSAPRGSGAGRCNSTNLPRGDGHYVGPWSGTANSFNAHYGGVLELLCGPRGLQGLHAVAPWRPRGGFNSVSITRSVQGASVVGRPGLHGAVMAPQRRLEVRMCPPWTHQLMSTRNPLIYPVEQLIIHLSITV